LLKSHGIAAVADVRAFPGSRRHPHFSRENLERSLPEAGIEYLWLGRELGGRRRGEEGRSPNTGLRNASFRNYADHMASPDFSAGIARLLSLADEKPTALLCAERLWWRCHRSLIADYLELIRGRRVRHILEPGEAKPHAVKTEARREGTRLIYAEPDLLPLAAGTRR
jgi:uncharacterized protein (DUF488 family)